MLLKLTDTAKIKAGNLELVDPISRGLGVQDKPCLLWLTLKLQQYHKGPGFSMPSCRAFQDCHRLLGCNLGQTYLLLKKELFTTPSSFTLRLPKPEKTKVRSF